MRGARSEPWSSARSCSKARSELAEPIGEA